jgi:hypothetical protein
MRNDVTVTICWRTSNRNNETVTIFWGIGNENDVTVPICYLVSNGNDVTVTVCGNDAHLCLYTLWLQSENFDPRTVELPPHGKRTKAIT